MERCGNVWMETYEQWVGRLVPTRTVLLVGNPDTEACTFETREEFEAFVAYGKKFFGIE